jgi:uncharacterized protein
MHPNETLIREGYDAFVRGDIEAVKGFLAPDVLWHISGTGRFAGVYKGHEELLGLFSQIFEMTEGTISIAARDILANEDHVIVLTTMKGQRGDRILDDDGVAIFKIRDGKAVEVWNFPEDQAAMDAFFADR